MALDTGAERTIPTGYRDAAGFTMGEFAIAHHTGISLLDEQHAEIFRWLDQLTGATTDRRTLFGVYVITRLKHCIREHFASEEALMASVGFPDLALHMAEHAELRTRLGELQLSSIGHDISTGTVDFLKDWTANHIARFDMAYVPYLKQ
jgi:hemerythrin